MLSHQHDSWADIRCCDYARQEAHLYTKLTKAKPLFSPVSRSYAMYTLLIGPKGLKSSCTSEAKDLERLAHNSMKQQQGRESYMHKSSEANVHPVWYNCSWCTFLIALSSIFAKAADDYLSSLYPHCSHMSPSPCTPADTTRWSM